MTGEKDAGIILLENILLARQQNPKAPIDIVLPGGRRHSRAEPDRDLKATAAPEAARRLYEFFLSDDRPDRHRQQRGCIRPSITSRRQPAQGRGAEVFAATLLPWTFDYLRETTKAREDIKRRFNSIVLESR